MGANLVFGLVRAEEVTWADGPSVASGRGVLGDGNTAREVALDGREARRGTPAMRPAH